jgi:hypothetical protein
MQGARDGGGVGKVAEEIIEIKCIMMIGKGWITVAYLVLTSLIFRKERAYQRI